MLIPVVLLQPGFEVPTMASAILWLVVGHPTLLDCNLARPSSPFSRRNGECAVPLSTPVPCLMPCRCSMLWWQLVLNHLQLLLRERCIAENLADNGHRRSHDALKCCGRKIFSRIGYWPLNLTGKLLLYRYWFRIRLFLKVIAY